MDLGESQIPNNSKSSSFSIFPFLKDFLSFSSVFSITSSPDDLENVYSFVSIFEFSMVFSY